MDRMRYRASRSENVVMDSLAAAKDMSVLNRTRVIVDKVLLFCRKVNLLHTRLSLIKWI